MLRSYPSGHSTNRRRGPKGSAERATLQSRYLLAPFDPHRLNPAQTELVAYLRRVILESDRVGRRLLDSIVQLSRTLNRRLQPNHRLRSEEGLARWDAAVEDLYLRGIYCQPHAPKRRGRSVGPQ